MDKRYTFFKKVTLYIVFSIVLVFALIKSQQFIVPILLAILFAYLLYPIAKFLEQKGVPRIFSNLVAILIAIGVIVVTVIFFSKQISTLTGNFSDYRGQIGKNIAKIEQFVSNLTGLTSKNLREWLYNVINNFIKGSGTFIKTVFSTTTSTIVRILLMPVFVFFMLYYRNKVHYFILQLLNEDKRNKAKGILDQINKVIIKYMTGVVIVVTILSVLHSIALKIIGLDYAILLGVTAAIFNFIPYFGTLIGAVFPLIFAFLTGSSLSPALWVIVYFLIIQFVENNILTPNITGGKVRLNPFVTILSLIFGSMVWGVAGMFLIIPYVAMIRIFCDHIDFLKPIGFILSDRGTEQYAITGEKIKRWFSRN